MRLKQDEDMSTFAESFFPSPEGIDVLPWFAIRRYCIRGLGIYVG